MFLLRTIYSSSHHITNKGALFEYCTIFQFLALCSSLKFTFLMQIRNLKKTFEKLDCELVSTYHKKLTCKKFYFLWWLWWSSFNFKRWKFWYNDIVIKIRLWMKNVMIDINPKSNWWCKKQVWCVNVKLKAQPKKIIKSAIRIACFSSNLFEWHNCTTKFCSEKNDFELDFTTLL